MTEPLPISDDLLSTAVEAIRDLTVLAEAEPDDIARAALAAVAGELWSEGYHAGVDREVQVQDEYRITGGPVLMPEAVNPYDADWSPW